MSKTILHNDSRLKKSGKLLMVKIGMNLKSHN